MEFYVGIGLSGAYIGNAAIKRNTDTLESKIESLDVCGGFIDKGNYVYLATNACLKRGKGYWSDSTVQPLCTDESNCLSDFYDFTLNGSTDG